MNKGTIILSAITAFLIGLSTSVITAVVEAKGSLPSGASWLVAILGALAVAAKDNRALLKLPAVEDSVSKSPPRVGLWLIGLLLLLGLGLGCAKIQPGNDPLVVRTEQLLTTSQATFQFVLQVDKSDTEFWKKNAPGFHTFAETLRMPTPYFSTNLLPQYRVWLLSTDDVKLAYKQGLASSNVLDSFNISLTAMLDQAKMWSLVVSNRNH